MKSRKSLSPYQSFKDDRKANLSTKHVHISQLLVKVLNPDNFPYFELEEMRCILDRAPINFKEKIKQIFHTFIFKEKSFRMPVSTFVEEFEKQIKVTKPVSSKAKDLSKPIQVFRSFRNVSESSHNNSRNMNSVNSIANKIQKKVRNLSKERMYITYDEEVNSSETQDQDHSWISNESHILYRSPSHRRFSSDVVKLTPDNPSKYKLDVSKAKISRDNSTSPYLDQRETALPSDATTPKRFEKLNIKSVTPIQNKNKYDSREQLIEVRKRHLQQSQISYKRTKE